MRKEKTAWLIIRIAIAFAFLYPAVGIHLNPDAWIGYFPPFVKDMIPQGLLLILFSIVHAGIAFWILSGKKIFIPSALATLFLAGVVATNLAQMDILFRDVSLLLVTLALAIENKPEKKLE